MEEERLTAEMAFKEDSSSVVIKIRRRLPDFLQSVKLKYVRLGLGYGYDSFQKHLSFFLLLLPLLLPVLAAPFIRTTDVGAIVAAVSSWRTDLVTFTAAVVSLLLLGLYRATRPRPVFLVDFSCYKPEEERKMSVESFLKMTEEIGAFSEETVNFQSRISLRSGLGDETYLPRGITSRPPNLCMAEARAEAEAVMFGSVDSLLAKTGIKAEEIGILIVNCSLFNPTPSLSSMIVNHYKLRTDVKSYNLGGMGCSAGLISIDLAKQLLTGVDNPNTYALVVSTENITLNWYFGNDRSMLLCNCIFRMGGAAVLLSNRGADRGRAKYELAHTVRTHKGADDGSYGCVYQREDGTGSVGVSLARELMAVAGDALKTNITTLGPLVLPLSEQLMFLVTLVRRKVLKQAGVKPYIPDFKLAFDHFDLHPRGGSGGAGRAAQEPGPDRVAHGALPDDPPPLRQHLQQLPLVRARLHRGQGPGFPGRPGLADCVRVGLQVQQRRLEGPQGRRCRRLPRQGGQSLGRLRPCIPRAPQALMHHSLLSF